MNVDTYRSIDVTPIAGALGAEINGVDLAADLADDVVAEIRRAWLAHLVVFFRDQSLAPEVSSSRSPGASVNRWSTRSCAGSTTSPRSSRSRSCPTRR